MAHSYKEIILLFLLQTLLIDVSLCNIVKRKAPDGKLYVFSKREGCVSVQSASPCTLNWTLNTYIAKVYQQRNDIVSQALNFYRQTGYLFPCINALKEALCSQVTPRCSESDYSRNYGDVNRLCNKVYSRCPSTLVDSLMKNNFCPKLIKGKRSNSRCVANNAYVRGVCPQPMFKMPAEFLDDYQRRSLTYQTSVLRKARYSNGKRILSDVCVSQIAEIHCEATYCSADETELLIKLDKHDCHQVIHDCLDKPIRTLSHSSNWRILNTVRNQQRSWCDTYPSSSSDLRPEPPRIATYSSSGHRCNGFLSIVIFSLLNLFLMP
ncbi:uncharacterized protein LOC124450392 [Xenia sp. Carnegie-2017]|uniref:uncharacterized protein LOC124450392 n=1 Tax=Xenia sp. Carnegie-2017 TaxID=2897299 RepID=UPI001F046937|nr:uncharacterized protein LOC124450392 [Xenia sp. Carnegie-2017]